MGKGYDALSKQKRTNDTYGFYDEKYSEKGIEVTLSEWYTLKEAIYKMADFTLVDLTLDVERAMKLKDITPEERLALGCRFGLQLMYSHIFKLTGIKKNEVTTLVKSAIEKMANYLNSNEVKVFEFNKTSKSTAIDVKGYLEELKDGKIEIFNVNKHVNTDLLEFLSANRDKLATETLRQRKEGMPAHIYNELFNAEYSEELYNCIEYTADTKNAKHEHEAKFDDVGKKMILGHKALLVAESQYFNFPAAKVTQEFDNNKTEF